LLGVLSSLGQAQVGAQTLQQVAAGTAQVGLTLQQVAAGAQQLGVTLQQVAAGAQQLGVTLQQLAAGAQQVGSTWQHAVLGHQQLGSPPLSAALLPPPRQQNGKQMALAVFAEKAHTIRAAERVIHFISAHLLEWFSETNVGNSGCRLCGGLRGDCPGEEQDRPVNGTGVPTS
jgi:hypothetical protein